MSARTVSVQKERQTMAGRRQQPETMRKESRAYFKALGRHVSALRKSQGMTQAELARAIGVSQQAVFAYELGERRISVLVLAKIAKVFSVSVEDLVGMSPPRAAKGRLSPRAMRHAERLQALTKTQQRFVIRIIDVLEFGEVKWSSNQHSRDAR
jgi:transcriptional regulator with XRE-family HTH domain